VNYIYLDNIERFNFINKSHEYLIPMVQNVAENNFYSSNISYKIPLNNPNKIIFWRSQLVSNYNSNNLFDYTLYPLTSEKENIINKARIILNSIKRMELSNIESYTNLQIYLNNYVYTSEAKGINMYSFALNQDYQPSGTMNFSQIDDMYIEMTLNKKINYQNIVNMRCYGIQYNILKIENGLGGLTYFL
jgi:hypothetical protein